MTWVLNGAASLPADAIEVGRIMDAWGVKGWFKIHAFNEQSQAFFSAKNWYLQVPLPRAGVLVSKPFDAFQGTVQLHLAQVKDHSGVVVASSPAVNDRDAAQSLKGARIFIARSDFPKLNQDEFYWADLMGMKLVNREGLALGVVDDLLHTGPQTTLVAGSILIPFVNAYIDSVDAASQTIHVDWLWDYSA